MNELFIHADEIVNDAALDQALTDYGMHAVSTPKGYHIVMSKQRNFLTSFNVLSAAIDKARAMGAFK